jgi:activator of 2-hydroxyglutaryl-CoA dehydratase/predicted nucleotide-binding protein (sugar kinase/HSP70/actin superfamily)
MERFVGIDVGAESLKIVELARGADGRLAWTRRLVLDHQKAPATAVGSALTGWAWADVAGAAATGRFSRLLAVDRVPAQQALAAGHRFLHGPAPAAIVSIGSHGFRVLELREGGADVYRENSRCAQGTGNFLRQLIERFGLTVEEAAALADGVDDAAPLSGRCPVILKTDLTHLANKGERRERLLAGLLDAICENVEVLVKPASCPARVHLAGGVARSARVRRHFAGYLARNGMTLATEDAEAGVFLDALGCAALAAEAAHGPPPLDRLLLPPAAAAFARLPPLSAAAAKVRRAPLRARTEVAGRRDVILGFDIGSTGSKAVALDAALGEPAWEGYLRTNGDPVGAAQALTRAFLEGPAGGHRVGGVGATGSGREIVGSLLATCFGGDRVFVLNEIAAHAAGALHHDPRVDTIFEIGGQDAKYIRLSGGRVVDAAMNEACSAGTGSFIEEQGRRFAGLDGPAELSAAAMAAGATVELGQHCSIFMAEIVDEAVAAGVDRDEIVAGIYDSVVANYLNRVKGSRSVGRLVFCQGMPFASDALAAAVARQTGAEVIVPPSPGTIGALGIALLAREELPADGGPGLDLRELLGARVEGKDAFVCHSTKGCGGAGNRCRIDRLTTLVQGERQRFTWGGGCAMHEQGARRRKLPDRTPDPFRARAERIRSLVASLPAREGRPVVALTDEFALKSLFPFFATFVHRLGFGLHVETGAGHDALKRGIERANVPFCAPMQQFHGVVSSLAGSKADFLLLPMLREAPRVGGERHSTVCPVVQGAPDVLAWDLGLAAGVRVVSPVIDVGDGPLDDPRFRAGCDRLAAALGVEGSAVDAAFTSARTAQLDFDLELLRMGAEAIAFARERGLVPVVVVGRPYSLHNDVLNSNVPSILREQGAVAIPLDCYPVGDDPPLFEDVYWGYGRRVLRAAWALRREPGVYPIFCSNYSCGPDSFMVHAFAHLVEGRPYAVIETDGHAADAGTRTRIEAFLHCVREDLRAGAAREPASGDRLTVLPETLREIAARGETILLPRMGRAAEVLAAVIRGAGASAECLPQPTAETIRAGRRETSGKECLPLVVTLGSLLERLERERGSDRRFAFFMPDARGPCRFGAYRNLQQLVLDRLGWSGRVRIWSPPFGNYFADYPTGLKAITFAAIAAANTLEAALHDVRPVERRRGAAQAIFDRAWHALLALIEERMAGDLSASRAIWEAGSGRLHGLADLLGGAARELAAVKAERPVPTVLVTGEVYVRADPGSNGGIVEQLERRGLRVYLEPSVDFLQWSDRLAWANGEKGGAADHVESWLRARILARCRAVVGAPLGWARHGTVEEVVRAGEGYMRSALQSETVVTLGAGIHGWRHGSFDAVVSVGPLECLPNKLAESQFFHVAEREGLRSLTLSMNGDPVDPEVLDNFAWEVRHAFARRRRPRGVARPEGSGGDPQGRAAPTPASSA